MAYKNKVYVAMDADNDLRYYRLMQAWKQTDGSSFSFYDAHDINNICDKSEESIKAGLQERFKNSKVFILLVGDQTKYLYKYVRWEIEQAIKRGLPCIVVNINGNKEMDNNLCPPIIRDKLAIHVSFNKKILQYALEKWPDSFEAKKKEGKTGAYHYKQSVYESLGLLNG